MLDAGESGAATAVAVEYAGVVLHGKGWAQRDVSWETVTCHVGAVQVLKVEDLRDLADPDRW